MKMPVPQPEHQNEIMSSIDTDTYHVSFHDGDDTNGVGDIVGTLLEQNLENFPSRRKIARKIRRPVTIRSTDTNSACTIQFGGSGAVVYNDVIGSPSVTVVATIDQIVDVARLRMRAGGIIPTGLLTKRGMTVIGAILTQKLVITDLFTHTLTALRIIALLSVAE